MAELQPILDALKAKYNLTDAQARQALTALVQDEQRRRTASPRTRPVGEARNLASALGDLLAGREGIHDIPGLGEIIEALLKDSGASAQTSQGGGIGGLIGALLGSSVVKELLNSFGGSLQASVKEAVDDLLGRKKKRRRRRKPTSSSASSSKKKKKRKPTRRKRGTASTRRRAGS
jgi:hypothetical protein